MSVVADAGPLRYLVLLEEIELLPALYGRVQVPAAVVQELDQPGTPAGVRAWISRPPHWLEVHTVVASAGRLGRERAGGNHLGGAGWGFAVAHR